MTALLNTAVCSKISFVDESYWEEASQLTFRSRLAGFCSIGAAAEGFLRTDYSSKILLLLKLFFIILSQLWLFKGVIFFRLKMPVNLNQYRAAIGVFNNRNLITNKKCFYFSKSNNVGKSLFPAINVMVFFFFFLMFVVSVH